MDSEVSPWGVGRTKATFPSMLCSVNTRTHIRMHTHITCVHTHTHTHAHGTYPSNTLRAYPYTQPVGQTLSTDAVSLSCLFSISPPICHCSNVGVGQRARKRLFLGGDSLGIMFTPFSPQAWKGGSGGERCVLLCVGTWVSRGSSSKGEKGQAPARPPFPAGSGGRWSVQGVKWEQPVMEAVARVVASVWGEVPEKVGKPWKGSRGPGRGGD